MQASTASGPALSERDAVQLGRALHIGVVGLGQGGGNLADEFARLRYPTIAVNSSGADLKSLSYVPRGCRLLVGDGGEYGAGGSLSLGGEAVREGLDRIVAVADQVLDEVEVVLAIGALGGGTGGNLVELVNALTEQEFPVVAIGVLPASTEGYRTKTNALWAVNELVDTEIDSLVLVDNEKLYGKHGDANVEAFLDTCNASVVRAIDDLNTLSSRPELTSVRTFDPNDLRQLLRFGGVTIFGSADISGEISRDALLMAFMETLNNNDMFATGVELEELVVIGSVVTAGAELLRGTSAAVFDDYFRETKLVTGGAAHRFGLYRSAEESGARLHVMAAGLPLPSRLHEMLAEATQEAQQFGTKKLAARVKLQRLDLSELGVGARAAEPAAQPAAAVQTSVADEGQIQVHESTMPEDDIEAFDSGEDQLLGEGDVEVIEGLLEPSPSQHLGSD